MEHSNSCMDSPRHEHPHAGEGTHSCKEHGHGAHSHCGHDHNGMHVHPVVKNLRLAFFINISFAVIEFIGGAMTNSVAILSDAIHDLGDGVVIGVAWWMEKFSIKGRSLHYSYGYRRFSTLAAFLTSVILLVGSALIIAEAIPRLIHPEEVKAGGMFMLAILGIAFNGLAVLRLKKSGDSLNQRAVMLHLMEDVLGWIAVLVGSIIIYYTAWYWIDPVMSLCIAAYILFNASKNIISVFKIFLQSVPDSVSTEEIRLRLREIRDIDDVHDIHVWSMDGSYHVLTAHVVMRQGIEPKDVIAARGSAIRLLKDLNIQHPTLQMEFSAEACGFERC